MLDPWKHELPTGHLQQYFAGYDAGASMRQTALLSPGQMFRKAIQSFLDF